MCRVSLAFPSIVGDKIMQPGYRKLLTECEYLVHIAFKAAVCSGEG